MNVESETLAAEPAGDEGIEDSLLSLNRDIGTARLQITREQCMSSFES